MGQPLRRHRARRAIAGGGLWRQLFDHRLRRGDGLVGGRAILAVPLLHRRTKHRRHPVRRLLPRRIALSAAIVVGDAFVDGEANQQDDSGPQDAGKNLFIVGTL